jgi:hypothetical protein
LPARKINWHNATSQEQQSLISNKRPVNSSAHRRGDAVRSSFATCHSPLCFTQGK